MCVWRDKVTERKPSNRMDPSFHLLYGTASTAVHSKPVILRGFTEASCCDRLAEELKMSWAPTIRGLPRLHEIIEPASSLGFRHIALVSDETEPPQGSE